MRARRIVTWIVVLGTILLAAAAVRTSARPVVAEGPAAPPPRLAVAGAGAIAAQVPAAQVPAADVPAAHVPAAYVLSETVAGATVTQVFTLAAGWNAIYLGVEPVNPSPLVNEGTEAKPQWVHEKSTLEAVFEGLAASGALESVWTYTQPVSSRDYLIDPGDGLWDEPGWLRYVPRTSVGPDGVSREFLTTLHTLHANTGYLVKLKAGAGGALTVTGKPAPGHHRWTSGAYHLTGFPLAAGGATVGAFTAGSPITEVRGLTASGSWTLPLASSAVLLPGVAYLVRYADNPASAGFTAPLDAGASEAAGLPAEGLKFRAGLQGNTLRLRLENLSAAAVQASLALPEAAAAKVALHYMTNDTPPEVIADLREGPAAVSLGAAPDNVRWITLQAPADEQLASGETLLEISCAGLGVRWLIPVSAEPGSYAGLWVGEVVVNDVSEARLGATDDVHDLAIALASQNDSGVRGAAVMHERIEGASTTLEMTVTLSLPAVTLETVTPPAVTAPYVHGWVFVDANQNGQRDYDEKGLAAVPVVLTRQSGGYSKSGVTLADGSYWLDALPVGTYDLAFTEPGGYARAFGVTLPPEELAEFAPGEEPSPIANAWPATVTLAAAGATAVTSNDPVAPDSYLAQVLPEPAGYPATPYLPYYDAYDQRVEPPLNLGLVRADEAVLRAGLCSAPREDLAALGTVKNGLLVTGHAATLASLAGDAHIAIRRNGAGVACGDIVKRAPTAFADGRGSEARFRILLRVNSDGQAALLPYYALDAVQRISAVNFLSLQAPVIVPGPFGGRDGEGRLSVLEFNLALPADDPLNPFKHKYNPDHDNLDRKYQRYAETVPTYMYESYGVDRRVILALSELPPGAITADAAGLDWGGAVWGGDYREVVGGLHQNTITARGYFVIQRVLAAAELVKQDYDK